MTGIGVRTNGVEMNSILSSLSRTPIPLQHAPTLLPLLLRPNTAYTYPVSRPVVPTSAATGITAQEENEELGVGFSQGAGYGRGCTGPPQQHRYNNPLTPTPYRNGLQHVNGSVGADGIPWRTSTLSHPQKQLATHSPGTLVDWIYASTRTHRQARQATTTRAYLTIIHSPRAPRLPRNKSFTQIPIRATPHLPAALPVRDQRRERVDGV
jgi:hypothetical protein